MNQKEYDKARHQVLSDPNMPQETKLSVLEHLHALHTGVTPSAAPAGAPTASSDAEINNIDVWDGNELLKQYGSTSADPTAEQIENMATGDLGGNGVQSAGFSGNEDLIAAMAGGNS